MTVDAHTGEIVEHSTADEARARADRIRGHLTAGYVEVTDAWRERDDLALGYASWEAYCAAEFTEGRMLRLDREQRREIVVTMRTAGMSPKAIGSAIGVSDETVRQDARSKNLEGATVTGLDGKTYTPPTRPPAPSSTPKPEAVPTPELTQEDAAKAVALAAEMSAGLGDARYMHLFTSKMKRSFELLILDPERIALLASPDEIRVLEDGGRAMAAFVAKVTAARNTGLRVVKGDPE